MHYVSGNFASAEVCCLMSISYFPFCCYDKNILNKSNLGKMEFIFIIRPGHNLSLRKVKAQGKKAGTWSRNHGRIPLSGSFYDLFNSSCLTSFLLQLGTNCKGNGASCGGRWSPTPIGTQDDAPTYGHRPISSKQFIPEILLSDTSCFVQLKLIRIVPLIYGAWALRNKINLLFRG